MLGARCLFATHYHQLAADLRLSSGSSGPAAYDTIGTRVRAAHMMALARPVSPQTLSSAPPGGGRGSGDGMGVRGGGVVAAAVEDIRFCYRLAPGPAPLGSCALNVARIAGFPQHLLSRAALVADTTRRVKKSREQPEGRPRVPLLQAPLLPPGPPPQQHPRLGDEALRCVRDLVGDPVVGRVSGAVGDDAWAGGFFALWQRCKQALELEQT